MKTTVSKGEALLWIITIIFMIICLVVLAFFWSSDKISSGGWSAPVFYLSVVSLLINAAFLVKYKVKITEFPAVMTLLTYLFMFGRVWLNYLGQDGKIYWVLHKLYEPLEMQRTGIMVVCCVHALFIGMISLYRKKSKREFLLTTSNIDESQLFNLGMILLVIGLPCRIITDIQSVISTSATGNFLSITANAGLIDDLAFLYVPGLICLMESRPAIKKPVIIILAAYFIVIMAVTGDRRYYVSAIVTFGAYMFRKKTGDSNNKVNIGKVILIVLLVALFLNFLEIIRRIRTGNLTDFFGFLGNYGADVFALDGLIYDVFEEFGISFFSVVSIVSCFPSVFPFQYGMTILRTIPSALPIGSLFGDLFSQASPSTYVNPYLGRAVGATMFGDLFSNFGLFCIPAAFLIGLMLGYFFRAEKAAENNYDCVRYYTYYYILINLVRCSLFEVFRPMIWCTFIPFVILSVLRTRKSRLLI
jgi:hypothetical protein